MYVGFRKPHMCLGQQSRSAGAGVAEQESINMPIALDTLSRVEALHVRCALGDLS
jgi:hypothetical protein